MGLLDRFKKQPSQKGQKADKALGKKEKDKKRKEQEEAKKKKMFQAVPGVGKEQKAEKEPPAAVSSKKADKAPTAQIKKDPNIDPEKILINPIITEKMTNLSVNNQYGFMVDVRTNKQEIKKAIEQVYGVSPKKVRIIKVKGKQVRTGRVEGRTKSRKKAIITLYPGDKIEVYETTKK